MAGFIIAFILVIIVRYLFLNWRKQYQAERELNELYRRRERKMRRDITPEPDEDYIYLTSLQETPISFKYMGSFKSSDKVKGEEGDLISVGDDTLVYYDGKWCRIIDDTPMYLLTKK